MRQEAHMAPKEDASSECIVHEREHYFVKVAS